MVETQPVMIGMLEYQKMWQLVQEIIIKLILYLFCRVRLQSARLLAIQCMCVRASVLSRVRPILLRPILLIIKDSTKYFGIHVYHDRTVC